MSAAPRYEDIEAVSGMTDEELHLHFHRKHEEPRERFLNQDAAIAADVCQPERIFR